VDILKVQKLGYAQQLINKLVAAFQRKDSISKKEQLQRVAQREQQLDAAYKELNQLKFEITALKN